MELLVLSQNIDSVEQRDMGNVRIIFYTWKKRDFLWYKNNNYLKPTHL